MRARRLFLAFALAAGLVSAASTAAAAEVGDVIALPMVQLLDGRSVPPSQWAGKPLVIEVWASWCPFCALQNPRLQALYERTHDAGLQVLTISIDKEPKVAVDYLKQRGYTFPATMDSPALRNALGPRKGLPELYVLDGHGRVVQKELGEMLDDDVAALARYAK